MSRVEAALMRLYENADLRDELTDDEAERLLKWAEAELTGLDTPALDDVAFEAQVDTLMTLLKQMNRYAGRQGQASLQGVSETPGRIAALASALGHPASDEQIAAAGTGEPGSTLDALTALLSAAPTNAPTDDIPPDEPPQAPPPMTDATTTPTDIPPDEKPMTDAKTWTWETYFDDDPAAET